MFSWFTGKDTNATESPQSSKPVSSGFHPISEEELQRATSMPASTVSASKPEVTLGCSGSATSQLSNLPRSQQQSSASLAAPPAQSLFGGMDMVRSRRRRQVREGDANGSTGLSESSPSTHVSATPSTSRHHPLPERKAYPAEPPQAITYSSREPEYSPTTVPHEQEPSSGPTPLASSAFSFLPGIAAPPPREPALMCETQHIGDENEGGGGDEGAPNSSKDVSSADANTSISADITKSQHEPLLASLSLPPGSSNVPDASAQQPSSTSQSLPQTVLPTNQEYQPRCPETAQRAAAAVTSSSSFSSSTDVEPTDAALREDQHPPKSELNFHQQEATAVADTDSVEVHRLVTTEEHLTRVLSEMRQLLTSARSSSGLIDNLRSELEHHVCEEQFDRAEQTNTALESAVAELRHSEETMEHLVTCEMPSLHENLVASLESLNRAAVKAEEQMRRKREEEKETLRQRVEALTERLRTRSAEVRKISERRASLTRQGKLELAEVARKRAEAEAREEAELAAHAKKMDKAVAQRRQIETDMDQLLQQMEALKLKHHNATLELESLKKEKEQWESKVMEERLRASTATEEANKKIITANSMSIEEQHKESEMRVLEKELAEAKERAQVLTKSAHADGDTGGSVSGSVSNKISAAQSQVTQWFEQVQRLLKTRQDGRRYLCPALSEEQQLQAAHAQITQEAELVATRLRQLDAQESTLHASEAELEMEKQAAAGRRDFKAAQTKVEALALCKTQLSTLANTRRSAEAELKRLQEEAAATAQRLEKTTKMSEEGKAEFTRQYRTTISSCRAAFLNPPFHALNDPSLLRSDEEKSVDRVKMEGLRRSLTDECKQMWDTLEHESHFLRPDVQSESGSPHSNSTTGDRDLPSPPLEKTPDSEYGALSVSELQECLREAVANENYELAAGIQHRINALRST